MPTPSHIEIKQARQHNLKGIDLRIPRGKLVVFTGVSGSGKSSLAFDTIYAEGQRRYVESLSSYARQFFDRLPKPDVEYIEGLPPTVAVEQKAGLISPRSTVATTTEIYDFLRLLYARVGKPHCHVCGQPIASQTVDEIVERIVAQPEGTRVMVLAPLVRGEKGLHKEVFERVRREGLVRVRVDGEIVEAGDDVKLDARKPHDVEAVVDRVVAGGDVRGRVTDSVELALHLADGMVLVLHEEGGEWRETLFTENYACPEHGVALEELSPRVFSFNSPHGACPQCTGLGTMLEFDLDLVVPDPRRPLEEAIEPATRDAGPFAEHCHHMVEEFAEIFGADIDAAFDALSEEQQQILLHGASSGKHAFEGILPALTRRLQSASSDSEKDRIQGYMSELPCSACNGARLRPEALAVTVHGQPIQAVTRLSIDAALKRVEALKLSKEDAAVAERILSEVRQRLKFLADVGVGYLTLDRRSKTLSGGEMQRIRLATQVGTGLVGMCYVLDEPTIGLHPTDNAKLIGTLEKLRDAGSTVLVVEHDEDTIRAADRVFELGPGPGAEGGRLVAGGTVDDLIACDASPTGQYLSGKRRIAIPEKRRSVVPQYAITVTGARANNLKNIDVTIPLGVFCCVTGVSGSGKSTLVLDVIRRGIMKRLYGSRLKPGEHDTLTGWELIEKLIDVDQSPIGRSPRSNAATYTNVFTAIRDLFAKTREARVRGYSATRFSFNAKGGRCEACEGQGTKKIDMQFLPDVFVTCEVCRGARYNRETLEVKYRGRTIAEVLDMRVDEAAEFFKNVPRIRRALDTLMEVGLGYIELGQSSTTLSGGEAQRVKLAAELGRRSKGRALYILDEPTTGLHFADIDRLLAVLNRLVDRGNSVLVIEHNLDVIAAADYLIDLGPGPGDAGGQIVATGTPEEVMGVKESRTGECLRGKRG